MPSLPAAPSNVPAIVVVDTPLFVTANGADTDTASGTDTAQTAVQTTLRFTSADPSIPTLPASPALDPDSSAQDAPPARPTDTDTAHNQNQNQNQSTTSVGDPVNANAATKDTASASVTAVSTDSAHGALSNTASTASPVSPTGLATFTSYGPDTQTQTQPIVGLGAVSSPSASASSIATALAGSNNTSFFANKPTVIGLFTVGGVILAIFFIYVLTRLRAASRRRRLERAMDDEFRETMDAQGAWRVAGNEHGPGAGLEHNRGAGMGMGGGTSMQRAPSTSSVASYGSLSYTQPPLAVAPQASYYSYGYEPGPGYAGAGAGAVPYAGEPAPAYAPADAPAPMGQIPQHAYPAQTYAQRGPAQGNYPSNYTQPPHPHPHQNSNPFGGTQKEKVLKVANE
ncbi:hypothetical protein B0H13DRAFT_2522036 [Mycena leptocephala]|nr:hypothetical protein B0H13DRAFT_2522036 [Mycena leptocephala]